MDLQTKCRYPGNEDMNHYAFLNKFPRPESLTYKTKVQEGRNPPITHRQLLKRGTQEDSFHVQNRLRDELHFRNYFRAISRSTFDLYLQHEDQTHESSCEDIDLYISPLMKEAQSIDLLFTSHFKDTGESSGIYHKDFYETHTFMSNALTYFDKGALASIVYSTIDGKDRNHREKALKKLIAEIKSGQWNEMQEKNK